MGLNAWPCFCHYGGMFPIVYLAVLMQSYTFSGKEKDVDFLLLKANEYSRPVVAACCNYRIFLQQL
jgi:hypothetical protein